MLSLGFGEETEDGPIKRRLRAAESSDGRSRWLKVPFSRVPRKLADAIAPVSQLLAPPDQAKSLYDMAKMPRSVRDSWYLRRQGSVKMRPIGLKVSESEIANI